MHPISYHYCPQCGHPLSKKPIGGNVRDYCSNCNFVHWGESSGTRAKYSWCSAPTIPAKECGLSPGVMWNKASA
ncbi:MAG: zinc ribbon domain-containing protein [Desulfitobacteriaceae bacterium]